MENEKEIIYVEVEKQQPPEDDGGSQVLGILGLIASGLSFFVGMFILQIVGILLAAIAPKKSELHVFAIILGVVSLFIDIAVINSYLY
jgi:uncharacterized protein YqhQ